jgi:hypothetical protein
VAVFEVSVLREVVKEAEDDREVAVETGVMVTVVPVLVVVAWATEVVDVVAVVPSLLSTSMRPAAAELTKSKTSNRAHSREALESNTIVPVCICAVSAGARAIMCMRTLAISRRLF